MKKTLAYATLCVLSTSAMADATNSAGFGFGVTAGFDTTTPMTKKVEDDKTTWEAADKSNNSASAKLAASYSFANNLSLTSSAKVAYSITDGSFKSVTPALGVAMKFNLTETFSLTPGVAVDYKYEFTDSASTFSTKQVSFPVELKAGLAVTEDVTVGLGFTHNFKELVEKNWSSYSNVALSAKYAFQDDSILESVSASVSMLGAKSEATNGGYAAALSFNF